MDKHICKENKNMENNVNTLKAHISLNVRNVKNSVKFYEKLFGIEPLKVRAGYAKFDIQNPPLNLALNEFAYNEKGALSHLGIQVSSTEDVLKTKARWEEIGLLTRDEMQTSCCYALQDKTWVRDPDGNEWEVFVVLEDNLPESEACECGTKLLEEETAAAGCCAPSPVGISSKSQANATSCC
jgi:catechol 2,3-dioxygenase-like lactoylglutathione lyase family enzyme